MNKQTAGDSLILVAGTNEGRGPVQAILEATGFRRVRGCDPDEIDIDEITRLEPDALVLDANIPDGASFALCRSLRERPAFADLPILMTVSDLNDRQAAFAAGATDVLERPIEINEVLARLRGNIERVRFAREVAGERENLERELREAVRLTRSILPSRSHIASISRSHGVAIDADYRPASRLSGDFWSILPLSTTRFAILVADVSGHGVSAALRAFGLHSMVFPPPPQADDPKAMIDLLNRRLFEIWQDTGAFTAAIYGVVDTADGVFRSVGAGLRNGLVLAADGDLHVVHGHGIPLGLFDDSEREQHEVPFGPGDTLVLYTDAVVECFDVPGAPRNEEEFAEWLLDFRASQEIPPPKFASVVASEFVDAYGDGITDDCLIVSVHRLPTVPVAP